MSTLSKLIWKLNVLSTKKKRKFVLEFDRLILNSFGKVTVLKIVFYVFSGIDIKNGTKCNSKK